MGDQQRGASRHDPPQGGVDLLLHPGVDRAGGVVEDQDAGIGDQRPGQRHPLALAARQAEAALAHGRLVALGQGGDELVGLRRPGRRLDLLVAGFGPPVGDVGGDGVGEKEALLEHHPDLRPQRIEPEAANIHPVHPHRPLQDVVEAGHEQSHRGLARTRRTHEGDGLAGGDVEIESVQHRLAGHVTEDDTLKVHRPLRRGQGGGVGRLDHLWGRRQQVEDPLCSRPGLLAHEEHRSQHAGRSGQSQQVGGEGEEGADAQVVVDGHPPTQGQHGHLPQHGDGLQHGLVAGLEAHGPHPGGVEGPGPLHQMVQLAPLLTETLDHPHSGDGLLHHGGHLALLLLAVPVGREGLLSHAVGDHRHARHHHQADQGQGRRVEEHDDQGDHHHQQVAAHDRQERQQGLQQADVGVGPGHQLAGLQLVVAGEVQPLQLVVDGIAEVVLDVEADPAAHVTADVGGSEGDGGGHDHDPQPRPQGVAVVEDDIVDDDLLHRGYHGVESAPHQGGGERQSDLAPVGGQPRQQATDPPGRVGSAGHFSAMLTMEQGKGFPAPQLPGSSARESWTPARQWRRCQGRASMNTHVRR